MFYFIFEILTITYFGNEIILKSSNLSYCLYESDWIDRSEVYKKIMLTYMEMLKQPERVIIGKIFRLNLDIFMSVSVSVAYLKIPDDLGVLTYQSNLQYCRTKNLLKNFASLKSEFSWYKICFVDNSIKFLILIY